MALQLQATKGTIDHDFSEQVLLGARHARLYQGTLRALRPMSDLKTT